MTTKPKRRWHLTAEETRQIRTSRLGGASKTSIARALRITRNTVALALKEMNFPAKLAVPEAEILELLHQSLGMNRIAAKLKISPYSVRVVAHKHHWRRPDRSGIPIDAEKRARLVAAIEAGTDYGIHLAAKLGVSYSTLLRYAHKIRRCPKFRAGPTAQPFTSNFPQREVQEGLANYVNTMWSKAITNTLQGPSEMGMFLVDLVLRVCFNGQIPNDDVVSFAKILTEWALKLIPPAVRDGLDPTELEFMVEHDQTIAKHALNLDFIYSTESLRRAHQAFQAATWTN